MARFYGQPGHGPLQRLARQVAANATIDVQGGLEADVGTERIHLTGLPPTQLQCFEILDCWRKRNPPPKTGASQGKFWFCNAKPVSYWWGQYEGGSASSGSSAEPECDLTTEEESSSSAASSGAGGNLHTYWDIQPSDTQRIFWAVSSPEDEGDWQRVLYPQFGIGQWVWCVFDYQSDVWRVLQPYDDLVRFRLKEPLEFCKTAQAWVVGYPCEEPESESSSSVASSSEGSSVSSESESSESVESSSSEESSASESESVPSSSSGCPSGFVSSSEGESESSASEESSSAPSSSEESSSAPSSFSVESESSAPEESSSAPSSSSVGSSSSSAVCEQPFSRGLITLHDPQGIVNRAFPGTCVAPECATGWAKRCADSQRFEVVSYGSLECSEVALEGCCVTLGSRIDELEGWQETYEAWRNTYEGCLSVLCPTSGSAGSGEASSSSSPSSSSGSSSGEGCRVVKDVWCNDDGSLTVTYCNLHFGPGGYCECDEGSGSAS